MSQCTRYAVDENSPLMGVIFTEQAANKVAALIEEEKNPQLKLRLRVQGGGCAGLAYDFSLDEVTRVSDNTTVTNGVTLLIDANSFRVLAGSTIDYVENIEGEHFIIDNPNAKKTCGCGTSFDVEEKTADNY